MRFFLLLTFLVASLFVRAQFCGTSAVNAALLHTVVSPTVDTIIVHHGAPTEDAFAPRTFLSFTNALSIGWRYEDRTDVVPTFSATWGRQFSERGALGVGASLLTFDDFVTLPAYLEGGFTLLRGASESLFLRSRVGYNFTLRSDREFPGWGFSAGTWTERSRGGLFHEHALGLRLRTGCKFELHPTVGYTFAHARLESEQPDWRQVTKIEHRRLTVGMTMVF